MAVHSFHVFDRKGQTLFTKRYGSKASSSEDPEQLSEQRKLVFGMLFSLRELSSSLSPVDGPGDLQLVKTGASVLYHYETVSGLRFVLYSSTPEYHQGRQRHASIGSGSGTPGSATSSNSSNNNNIGGSGSGGSSSHGGSSGGVAAGGGGGDNTAGSSSALSMSTTAAQVSSSDAPGSIGMGIGISNHSTGTGTSAVDASEVRSALRHIYETLWVGFVVRSPMYRPQNARQSIAATGFEAELDKYLKHMPWFR